MDEKCLQGEREKPPRRLHIGTFRKLLLITTSRRLGVMLMGLPSYGRGNNQLKNTLLSSASQEGNLLLKLSSFSGQNY
jgi:hypothetical protein